MLDRSLDRTIGWPLTSVITSPDFRPAAAAALFGATLATSAPSARFRPNDSASDWSMHLDLHAQAPVRGLDGCDDLILDLQRHVDRNREAQALEAAALRVDLRIDADHLALPVEQRPPELPGFTAASVWMNGTT